MTADARAEARPDPRTDARPAAATASARPRPGPEQRPARTPAPRAAASTAERTARRSRRVAVRSRRGALAAALSGFAVLLVLVRLDRTTWFDLNVTLRLQRGWPKRLDPLMAAASWPGFPPQSRILPPLVVAGWLAAGRRRAAAFQLAAWGSALLSTVIKLLVRRPRPLPTQVQVLLGRLQGSSFPSGHVLTFTGFYGFLVYLLGSQIRHPLARGAAQAIPLGLIAAVGPSRVQRGHHWATDVAASYLLGLAYVLGLSALYERRGSASRDGDEAAR